LVGLDDQPNLISFSKKNDIIHQVLTKIYLDWKKSGAIIKKKKERVGRNLDGFVRIM
jgi:hypothetical protein